MANPETAERRPRIDHERAVVLALADPGRLDKDGKLQKPTHREIAERLNKETLSRLAGKSRDVRLSTATKSVRDIGKEFIDKLNDLGYLKEGDLARTIALFKEIKEMYPERSLEPNDLYGIFGISQSETHNPFGSHYLNITAPPLPQPDPNSANIPIDIASFMNNVMAPGGTDRYIGKKNCAAILSGQPSPLKRLRNKIKITLTFFYTKTGFTQTWCKI